MTHVKQLSSTWWGRYQLNVGQAAQWTVGSLKLAIRRLANEWQITYDQNALADPETTAWSRSVAQVELDQLDYANLERYIVRETGEALWLRPALADRPVVTRPVTPLYVPAGAEATIFVSTPLWVTIEAGEPPQSLRELPAQCLSDTWFGPSTMEGELCYADQTFARLNLENIPRRVHRVITQVIVHNRAASQLLIERLSLPLPYLSLFEASGNQLWTQAVALIRTRDTALVDLQVEPGPPAQAEQARLISGPRQPSGQQPVIRAFGALFR